MVTRGDLVVVQADVVGKGGAVEEEVVEEEVVEEEVVEEEVDLEING